MRGGLPRRRSPTRRTHTSELNHAFHFYIYRAAGSAVLIPIVESLWLQSGPYVRAAAQIHDEQRDIPATHHHWALIEALERGDAAASVKALTDDITRSFNLVRGRLDAEATEERRRPMAERRRLLRALRSARRGDGARGRRRSIAAPRSATISSCAARCCICRRARASRSIRWPRCCRCLPAKQRPTAHERLDDDRRRDRLPRSQLHDRGCASRGSGCAASATPRPRRCRSMTERRRCSASSWRRTTRFRASSAAAGRWPAATAQLRSDDPIGDMVAFADAGITTFDCADIYTGVEELIGEFRQRYRDAARRGGAGARSRSTPNSCPTSTCCRASPRAYVEGVIDQSLRRLQTGAARPRAVPLVGLCRAALARDRRLAGRAAARRQDRPDRRAPISTPTHMLAHGRQPACR